MATILDSATLERMFWLQCGEWIIIKSRVEARQQDIRYYSSSKKKTNTRKKKRISIRNTDFSYPNG